MTRDDLVHFATVTGPPPRAPLPIDGQDEKAAMSAADVMRLGDRGVGEALRAVARGERKRP